MDIIYYDIGILLGVFPNPEPLDRRCSLIVFIMFTGDGVTEI